MSEARAVVIGPGGGETVRNPVGGLITFKVRGEETRDGLTVFESEIAPGDGPPLHVHEAEAEVLYVLAGDMRFQLGDDIHAAPPGSLMYVPPGVPHCFQNVGDSASRLLIVFNPSGMERFFGLTDGDPAVFREAAAQVGMQVVGPPLRS